MKILELTGEPIGTGGQEMFIVNVLRHIDMTDFHIDWLTPYFCENETYRKEIEDRGGEVICFNLPFIPGGSRLNIIKPLHVFLRTHHYDAIHVHSGSTSVLAICSLIARLNKVRKIVVHSHCTGLHKNINYYLLKVLTYPFFKLFPTDYLACSADAGKWKFPSCIVRKKLCIINNGIDLNKFHFDETVRKEIRERYGISDGTIVMGHVGRFSYQKNQEFLVELLGRLRSDNVDVMLMFVGVGETMDMIKERVRLHHLQERVVFVGSVNNVSDFMQAMDVFVFPSRWEGLGIVGIEAQAIGIPVIASTKVPVAMKLVDDVEYIPLDDMDRWMQAVIRMAAWSRKGNERLIRGKGYDINSTAMNVRNIYLSR